MDIKMIYKGESFWGTTTQREDEMHWANMKHLSKCLRRLKVDPSAAVHITDYSQDNKEKTIVLAWATYTDQENGILMVKEYERWNSYDSQKMAFEKAKKHVEYLIVKDRFIKPAKNLNLGLDIIERRCEDEI